jgi:pyruvate dehydrogenase E1 component alpha subunit
VERARRGEGPAFLVCNTYRYHGHHVGDINRAYYRSKQEEQEWKEKRDPIKILGDWVIGKKMTDQSVLDRIEVEVREEIGRGAQFALDAAFPEASEVTEDVYA